MDLLENGMVASKLRLVLFASTSLMYSATAGAQVVTYVHTDALGSVVAETNGAGVIITRYDYEPYGAAIGERVADGPGYTGHVSDAATGLSYMQQRYMDPQLGVFLSVDPVTAYGQPAGQFNRYRYANGNPYRFTDPDGRCPEGAGRSTCIDARRFDQSRSSGLDIQLSAQTEKTALANTDSVRVGSGNREKAVTIEASSNGTESIRVDPSMATSSDASGFYAELTPTADTVAVMHGHLEESGLVDRLTPGDSGPLVSPGVPNITVDSTGSRVGVRELVDGKVQFRMIQGRMTPTEQRLIQQNITKQQELFYLPGSGR